MTLWHKIGYESQDRLLYAFRTACAAILALVVAWLIGLEHPQWAAMSVWAGSQPLRGQLLEKGALRIVGTIIGTLAGILLVQLSLIHPMLLVFGLAVWMAICTCLNNLLRGFIAYGAALAGYTAAMVALLDINAPHNVFMLGLDRFLTVITGVGVAMAVGLIFAPKADTNRLRRSIRELLADALTALARQADRGERAGLLSRLALAEEGLDPHAAGSLRSHAEIKAARMVLISLVSLLLKEDPSLQGSDAFAQAAEALRKGDIEKAAQALAQEPYSDEQTAASLRDLAQALHDWNHTPNKTRVQTTPLVLHRDWVGAKEATLRSFGAILLFGTIWQVTGWQAGNFMLLGLSIMISLFSSFESPLVMMRAVIIGQIMGIMGVLACRWLVWPHMDSQFELILSLMPFIMIGALIAGNRFTAMMSFDYNMLLLLLSQPNFPLTGSFGGSLSTSISVVSAPLVAWVLYRTIFPATLARRITTLESMIQDDLAQLAADPKALSRRMHWRARLYHRTLRLIRLSARFGRGDGQAVDLAFQTLQNGQAIMRLHQVLQRDALSPSQRRAAKLGLARAERITHSPQAFSRTLERLCKREI